MIAGTHLYTWVKRDNVEYKVPCLRKQHGGRGQARTNALTTRSPHLDDYIDCHSFWKLIEPCIFQVVSTLPACWSCWSSVYSWRYKVSLFIRNPLGYLSYRTWGKGSLILKSARQLFFIPSTPLFIHVMLCFWGCQSKKTYWHSFNFQFTLLFSICAWIKMLLKMIHFLPNFISKKKTLSSTSVITYYN